ncbi:hypothetical protein CRI77_25035 [Mycolicibacterium duvalii]|uniref:Uncharacterized protein n=1 Tax=Mycolicibacterium duvalii TaxID=39688 RepID=A0A7I7JYI8_9MYCO|nr:hypothetical protein [Mycolicibacterium duvalii]MCV7368669.1 hypothetical protein [Mycolicibacterium duvalii]PEG35630.1 hypothetical protein CRI77_25035 [Mycolicibacterium duvalii]BBX16960.1 hypothetical protein MDUV_18200 [Mycolicibacterium duvalii]
MDKHGMDKGRNTMSRRQRRQHARTHPAAAQIQQLRARVNATGQPGVLSGLTDACRDCRADGQLILLPGDRIISQIFHDDGCPAATGVVDWKPVSV